MKTNNSSRDNSLELLKTLAENPNDIRVQVEKVPLGTCEKEDTSHAEIFAKFAKDTADCYDAFRKAEFDDSRAWYMAQTIMTAIIKFVIEED